MELGEGELLGSLWIVGWYRMEGLGGGIERGDLGLEFYRILVVMVYELLFCVD